MISSPERFGNDWKAVLRIESPSEEPRELNCFGADELDAILYGVKLAAININVFKQEGVDLRWLNDEDCGFEYPSNI